MPELPEVETIRRFLQPTIIGLTIKKIDILTPKSFVGNPKLAEGQKIIDISRHGKQLSFHLSNNLILHFHLKMTGQIILVPPLSRGGPEGGGVSKSTRVIFYLDGGEILFFNDQRKFGWIKIISNDELAESQSHLGRDLLDSGFSLKYFTSQLNSRRPVKLVLLDQSRFAGIGNIYANDSLFAARIHPLAPANSLSSSRAKKLYQSVLEVINRALSRQGSTAADGKYLLPDGSPGSHQYYFQVYQRAGEPCPACSGPLSRIILGGRGTFFCPHCQKL